MRLSLSTKVVQNPKMMHAFAGEEVMMMDVARRTLRLRSNERAALLHPDGCF